MAMNVHIRLHAQLLYRPRSMEGGDLRWFWSGFDMYERIDNVSLTFSSLTNCPASNFLLIKVYSVKGYHEKAGFAPAAGIVYINELLQILMNYILPAVSNLLETSLNVC